MEWSSLQHDARLQDGKFEETIDCFVKLCDQEAPRATSWSSIQGLSIQQKKAVFCLAEWVSTGF